MFPYDSDMFTAKIHEKTRVKKRNEKRIELKPDENERLRTNPSNEGRVRKWKRALIGIA